MALISRNQNSKKPINTINNYIKLCMLSDNYMFINKTHSITIFLIIQYHKYTINNELKW